MSIKHIWTIVCKESVINQDDNNISLLGSLEEIQFTLIPQKEVKEKIGNINVPFNYQVVSYWVRKDDKKQSIEVRVSFIDPEGKSLGSNINEGIFPVGIKRLRTRLKVSGMVLSIPGRYLVRVEMRRSTTEKFTLCTEVPIDIKIIFENPKVSSVKN